MNDVTAPEAAAAPVAAPVEAPVSSPAAQVPAAPAASVVASAAPAADAPAAPQHEFPPSLLDEAGPPAATPADHADAKDTAHEAAPGEQPVEPVAPDNEAGANAAPVYEFTYPEGFDPKEVDQERFGAFTGLLGENKVAPESAQKLLDMHVNEVRSLSSRMLEQQWDVFNRQQERAQAEVRADPEVGGARMETAMRAAGSFIEQFGGSPEEQARLRTVLRTTGAGNDLTLVKAMYRAGLALASEGAPITVTPPRTPTVTPEERGRRRYAASGTPGAGA